MNVLKFNSCLRTLSLQPTRGLKSLGLLNKRNQLCSGKNLNFICQIRRESNDSKTEFVYQMPDAVDKAANLFSDSPITQLVEEFLINFHDMCSLEWSSTIFLSALFLRVALCFPFRIYQERLQAKGINLQPVIKNMIENNLKNKESSLINTRDFNIRFSADMQKKLAKEFSSQVIFHHNIKIIKNKIKSILFFQVTKIRERIYKENKFAPQLIPLASLVQLPFWICFSTSFRDFSFGINCK